MRERSQVFFSLFSRINNRRENWKMRGEEEGSFPAWRQINRDRLTPGRERKTVKVYWEEGKFAEAEMHWEKYWSRDTINLIFIRSLCYTSEQPDLLLLRLEGHISFLIMNIIIIPRDKKNNITDTVLVSDQISGSQGRDRQVLHHGMCLYLTPFSSL